MAIHCASGLRRLDMIREAGMRGRLWRSFELPQGGHTAFDAPHSSVAWPAELHIVVWCMPSKEMAVTTSECSLGRMSGRSLQPCADAHTCNTKSCSWRIRRQPVGFHCARQCSSSITLLRTCSVTILFCVHAMNKPLCRTGSM